MVTLAHQGQEPLSMSRPERVLLSSLGPHVRPVPSSHGMGEKPPLKATAWGFWFYMASWQGPIAKPSANVGWAVLKPQTQRVWTHRPE